jgi:hypothetical protein
MKGICGRNLGVASFRERIESCDLHFFPLLGSDWASPQAELEISFESRFLLAHPDADGSLSELTKMIERMMRDLPQDSPARGTEGGR